MSDAASGISTSVFKRIHGSSTDYSWNSQLLPQGDAVSGLLPGIDRRVTAADVTGARGYDISRTLQSHKPYLTLKKLTFKLFTTSQRYTTQVHLTEL